MRGKKLLFSLLPIIAALILVGCTTEKQLKEQVKKIISEDPAIIISAIKAKPADFIEALQEAARAAQMEMAKKQEEERSKELENSYTNPLKPKIRPDENIRGNKNAPILLVEYSDFECPYCSRGTKTVEELIKKYGDKIQFVFKHLPLEFHSHAMPAAMYYEAIRMQDGAKAYKFHDELFTNQKDLQKGEEFLKSIAKKVGADMKKLEKDLKSGTVKNRIAEDQKEAQEFGFQGTPGFVINGIPVKGAYPSSHFEGIVEELKKRGKLSL